MNLNDGKIHVVEFWATWCGPCKVSIPHLTQMAKKYKGKADFTGVSVFEVPKGKFDDTVMPKVVEFVKTMGATMDYNVAADGASATMATTWMDAANQNGIPTAFVIGKDGKIAWIGHPMGGLDEVVGQVIAGTFDAKAEAAKQAAAAAKQAEMEKKFVPLNVAYAKQDWAAVSTEVDKILAEDPSMIDSLGGLKVNALLHTNENEGYALISKYAATTFKDNQQMLNTCAWYIVGGDIKLAHPDYALAIKIGNQAVALDPTEYNTLDTLATAYFASGDTAKAISISEKAIAAATVAKADAKSMEPLKKSLAKFKATKA